MPEGRIVKALSGFYYVQVEDSGQIWQCRARGVFKNKGINPLVGDFVRFAPSTEEEGVVQEISARKNELIRPPIANVDQALLVFSVAEPELNLPLLDKFLVHIEQAGIQPVLCLSKSDLDSFWMEENRPLLEVYRNMGYTVLVISSFSGQGLEQVKEVLQGKVTVLAGQSGVGKSSLLNALIPDLHLETQQISAKLGRGRHTTRHVELIMLPEGGMVADTPGFSQLDFAQITPEELGDYFPEMAAQSAECRFRACLHHNEPGCAVKEAVQEARIASFRYEHYVQFLQELLLEHQRKRY